MGKQIEDLGTLDELDALDWFVVQEESSGVTKKVAVQKIINLGIPIGTITPYGGSSAPTAQGWLLCDGSEISRNTYSALFGVIGTAYGSGNGTTTFNVPNLKGRTPVGYDSSQSYFNTIGKLGGAATHTLTTSEMPSHSHSAWTDAQGNHQHTVGGGARWGSSGGWGIDEDSTATSNGVLYTDAAGSHGHNVGIGNNGGGAAHNNLQPYSVTNFIIKSI